MKSLIRTTFLCLLLSLPGTRFGTALAQGTAFTYQGQLGAGGSPAQGSYDFVFTLYATNLGGAVMAGPVTNRAVTVANGLFTTTVDFGNAFNGTSNWLQIAVSTNAANAFSGLSPRQQLTPVPYAVTAQNLSGTVAATNLSGPIALAQLPSVLVTNDATGLNLSGSFNGNGSGLTNLNMGALVLATNWLTYGNLTNLYMITNAPDAGYDGIYTLAYMTNVTFYFAGQLAVRTNIQGRFMMGDSSYTNDPYFGVTVLASTNFVEGPGGPNEAYDNSALAFPAPPMPSKAGNWEDVEANLVPNMYALALGTSGGFPVLQVTAGDLVVSNNIIVGGMLTLGQPLISTNGNNILSGTFYSNFVGTATGAFIVNNALPEAGSFLPPVNPDWNFSLGPQIALATWPFLYTLDALTNELYFCASNGLYLDFVAIDITFISQTNWVYWGTTNNGSVVCPGGITNLVAQVHNAGYKIRLPLERYNEGALWAGPNRYNYSPLTNLANDVTTIWNLGADGVDVDHVAEPEPSPEYNSTVWETEYGFAQILYNSVLQLESSTNLTVNPGTPFSLRPFGILFFGFSFSDPVQNVATEYTVGEEYINGNGTFPLTGSAAEAQYQTWYHLYTNKSDYVSPEHNYSGYDLDTYIGPVDLTNSFNLFAMCSASMGITTQGGTLGTIQSATDAGRFHANSTAYLFFNQIPFVAGETVTIRGVGTPGGGSVADYNGTNIVILSRSAPGILPGWISYASPDSRSFNEASSNAPTADTGATVTQVMALTSVLTNTMLINTIYKDPLCNFMRLVATTNPVPAFGTCDVFSKPLAGGNYAVMWWNHSHAPCTFPVPPGTVDASLTSRTIRLIEPYGQTVYTNTSGAMVIPVGNDQMRMFLLQPVPISGITTNITITGGATLHITNGIIQGYF